jgi:hypothetical protein
LETAFNCSIIFASPSSDPLGEASIQPSGLALKCC